MNPIQVFISGINSELIANKLKEENKESAFFNILSSPENCSDILIIGKEYPNSSEKEQFVHKFQTEEDLGEEGNSFLVASYEPKPLATFLTIWLQGLWLERKLKKTEKQKDEAEERFGIFVSNNSDIVTLLDDKGGIIYQSSSLQQKMGYTQNELKGRSLFEIIHPEDLPIVLSSFSQALKEEGISQRIEFRLLDKSGKYLYLEAVGNNQLKNPLIRAFIVHSHDISERKKEEQEKNQMIQHLIQQNSDLKQFAFITTHNLRAPLTNLQAILELSEQGEPLVGELEVGLRKSIKNLEETVKDLVQILFLKEKEKPELKWILLQVVFEKALQKMQAAIQSIDAKIGIDFPANSMVYCNPIVLQEILEQFIQNSIQFRDSSRELQIRVDFESGEKTSKIHFSDNGTGFDAIRLKDRVFGFYQRFHRHGAGKGLGLFFAQEQAKSCNSWIEVKSEVDKGSTFSLIIEHPKY